MEKRTEFCYPSVETWFICWDDPRTEIKGYGSIDPTQCLASEWIEIDYYTDMETWIKILEENGIDPGPFGPEDEEENE